MRNKKIYTETKDCKQCGKTIQRIAKWSISQWENKLFCSPACQKIGRDTTYKGKTANIPELTCCVCGKIFKMYKSARRYNTVHCSKKCSAVTISICNKGRKLPKSVYKKIVATRRKTGSYFFSLEHRKKISDSHLQIDKSREKNPNWRGGYDLVNALRKTVAYNEWRKLVFKRDDWKCQICGQRGGKLHADHIKRYIDYPELRLDVSNGRTLCVLCHTQTDTWGSKGRKKQMDYAQ